MEINRIENQTALWQAAQTERKQAPQETGEQTIEQTAELQKAAAAAQTASADVATVTQTEDSDNDATYQAIVNKVNSGQALSSSELSTLRTKNAGLYAQAVRAQQAREQLKEQMQANPSSAEKAAREAISALDREEGVDRTPEESAALRQALDTEYRQFAGRYDQVALSGQVFR